MSITSVNYKPHVWSSAYNPIVWSVTSDKNTEIDFSYVVDLYINGATGYTYRLKQRPNPSGAGLVDVSPILQSFIALSGYAAEEGYPDQYRNGDEILANVYIKVGEEYIGTDGSLTIFNGSGATGAPAYTVYTQEGSDPCRVVPSALPYEQGIDHLASTATGGVYAPYVMDGNGQFLSLAPLSQNIGSNEVHTLTLLNWWDDAPGSYRAGIQGINVDYYGATGFISSEFLYNNTTTGGGPQTLNTYTTLTESRATDLLTVKVGPANLTVPVNATYYEVKAYAKTSATSSTSPGSAVSETRTFVIDDDPCASELYEPVRLSFLNELGGRDYYTFRMFYEKTSRSQGDVYSQATLNWSGTTPVVVDGSGGDQTQNWLRGGNKSFNKTVTRDIRIQTDWLTQEWVDMLGQIPESPSVWAYIGNDPNPYTLQVTNLDYAYKNTKQTKLVLATIEASITKTQIKQNM